MGSVRSLVVAIVSLTPWQESPGSSIPCFLGFSLTPPLAAANVPPLLAFFFSCTGREKTLWISRYTVRLQMYHCPEGASWFETWRTFCLLSSLTQKPPARWRHSVSALALTLMIPKSLTTDDAWASKSFYMHLLRLSLWCRGWPYSSLWSKGLQHLATVIANLVFQLDTPSKKEPQLKNSLYWIGLWPCLWGFS